ncbi:hypothetical protein D3C81_1451920 [compost metagenome]
MARFTADIPQGYRVCLWARVEPRHAGNPFGDLALGRACCSEATEVALDIGSKYRHASIAERFGQALQGDGLAGTGSTRDQAMTVGQAHFLGNRLALEVGTENELREVRHFFTPG